MSNELATFARECFGNFFTRGKWANEVLPTEEIEAAIQNILAFDAKHPQIPNRCNFEDELVCLLNKYSKENDSNTPDFVLAEYVRQSLSAFAFAVVAREEWYGRGFAPGSLQNAVPAGTYFKDDLDGGRLVKKPTGKSE
jgi:hypothetical protein